MTGAAPDDPWSCGPGEDQLETDATLVAIARNESRHIVEWIAYHLAIGFSRILVFNHESTDATPDILRRVSRSDRRVGTLDWPSREGESPQVSAYNHGLALVRTPWVVFLDIDEFLAPFASGGLREYLQGLPEDVSSVHVNWRGFGSSGLTSPDYELVTRAFSRCAPADWINNHHFKTIARRPLATAVFPHLVETSCGRRVLSDMREFEMTRRGLSNRVVYDGIQIHHYQCKTYPEFRLRMRQGKVTYPEGHPKRVLDDSLERFAVLDRNEEEDTKIRMFDDAVDREYAHIARLAQRPVPDDGVT